MAGFPLSRQGIPSLELRDFRQGTDQVDHCLRGRVNGALVAGRDQIKKITPARGKDQARAVLRRGCLKAGSGEQFYLDSQPGDDGAGKKKRIRFDHR